jgi:Mg2+ and Co2+ transporter CorA
MDVRWIGPAGTERYDVTDLAELRKRTDGVLWVDVPVDDPDAAQVLGDVFEFDTRAVSDSLCRNPSPKLHVYADHVFVILHTPEPGKGGHVHTIELDAFLSASMLVTVHGPVNPALDPAVALVDTNAVAARLDSGRWLPDTGYDVLHAIVTALNRHMTRHLAQLTNATWDLERTVTAGHLGNPEQFLEEMFGVSHGLQAVRTCSALNHEIFARMAKLGSLGTDGRALVDDALDQFEHVQVMAQAQKESLLGVITLYQTRTNTKMTIAAERLAVIAAVTLPVTAVSSIVGMNVIVNDSTHYEALAVLLLLMALMSGWLLFWAKRQGWW